MYYIDDYDNRYRPYDRAGREPVNATFVKLPINPKGDGLQKLFEHKGGVEAFTVFALMLEKATKQKPEHRGKLLNHKEQPATIEEIAKGISLGRRIKMVERSISVLLSMGWVKSDSDSEQGVDSVSTQRPPKIRQDKDKDKDKEQHLDFVFLLKEEYQKLIDLYGKVNTDSLISDLNTYIGSKGKRYKSHYFTLLNWAKRNGTKVIEKPKPKSKEEPIKEATLQEKEEIKKRSKVAFKTPKGPRRINTRNVAQQQRKELLEDEK